MLPFWYEDVIKSYFKIDGNNISKWEVIKSLGYAIGVVALLAQISISSRRTDASEESNLNQRYHNAIDHLSRENTTARIGAIYNLYNISKSSRAYCRVIFDIFCTHLKGKGNNFEIRKEEKQLIVDKLFRARKEDRVLSNPQKVELQNIDFTDINFEKAFLREAKFIGTNLESCSFKEADLTESCLPAELKGVKSMEKAILNKTEFKSGSILRGLIMNNGKWKDAKILYSDLSNAKLENVDLTRTKLTGTKLENANLKGANLKGANLKKATLENVDLTKADLSYAKNLTFNQLVEVSSLHGIIGLDEKIERKLKTEKPELFQKKQENIKEDAK